MNKPIINPLWIYLSDVIPNIGVICLVMGIIILISCTLFFFGLLFNYDSVEDFVEDNKLFINTIKKSIITSIVMIIIGVLCPNQKTIQTMMVASYVTPQNINTVGESAKDVVDYIFEKVEEVKEDKEDK